MGKLRLLLFTAVILVLPRVALSDIIVTTDDMTLNGKIIEDIKNDHVKLGNLHGIFTIKYGQIKEKHRTDNYQEDMNILKKMGKNISELEVRTNFQAGIDKLEEKKISGKKLTSIPVEYVLFVSPFFIFNIGKIQPVLPYSFGAFLLNDIRFQSRYQFLPNGIRLDLQYFHAVKGIKKISAFRFGIGTMWTIPFEVRGFNFNLTLSPVFGTGYYAVKGAYEKADNFKWNASVAAGLEFLISSWVISPQVRFDYIYDGAVPVYGIGFSIGAGYLFKI